LGIVSSSKLLPFDLFVGYGAMALGLVGIKSGGPERLEKTLPNHCLTVKVDIPDRFDCYRCLGINISQ
jgi:hypothetical protein